MTKNVKDEAVTAADRNYRKTRQGYVVSDKMDKTVVVEVEDRVKHALYGKVLRRSSKVKAHDEENAAGIGDRVLDHGDPTAVGHQALARGGDPREGQVVHAQHPPPTRHTGETPGMPRGTETDHPQFGQARRV